MLADKVAGERLCEGFVQRFAAQRGAQPQPVNQRGEPVARLFSLFTRQFYRFLTRHLEQDGVLIQWMQTYELNDPLFYTMVAALMLCPVLLAEMKSPTAPLASILPRPITTSSSASTAISWRR